MHAELQRYAQLVRLSQELCKQLRALREKNAALGKKNTNCCLGFGGIVAV
jgi:hypothetical protein